MGSSDAKKKYSELIPLELNDPYLHAAHPLDLPDDCVLARLVLSLPLEFVKHCHCETFKEKISNIYSIFFS